MKEQIRNRSDAMRARWNSMPRSMRWAAMAALILFLYLLPNRWFYLNLWYFRTM
jgi:branched-chain amino acid transport system permease protein